MYDGQCKTALKTGLTGGETLVKHFSDVTERIESLKTKEVTFEIFVQSNDDDEPAPCAQPSSKAARFAKQSLKMPAGVEEESAPDAPTDPLEAAARKLIHTHIAFVSDVGGSDASLADKIAATTAGSYVPSENGEAGKGYCLLIYDSSNAAESCSHPHLRKPALVQANVDRVVNVGLQARTKVTTGTRTPISTIPAEDMWLLFDGGRQLDNQLTRPFKDSEQRKALDKSNHVLFVSYDEDTSIDNIGRTTALGSLKLVESCLCITQKDIFLPRRPHTFHKGSNYSDQIGPVRVESWDDDGCWKLSRKDKKLVFGRFKVELGGAVDEGLAKNSKWRNREVEPVFFHQKPYTVCFDLASGFFARSVVDFTAHSGPWALVCLRKRIPYVGITCSESHSELLREWLVTVVKKALQDPDDPLHKPEFAVAKKKPEKPAPVVLKQGKRGAADPPEGEKGAKQQKADAAKSAGNAASDKAAIVAKLQTMLKKKSAKDKESTAAKGGADTEEDGDASEEAKDSGEEE